MHAFGLVMTDKEGKKSCMSVKDAVSDLPVVILGGKWTTYRVVRCPCGIHGCCEGKMPCLDGVT